MTPEQIKEQLRAVLGTKLVNILADGSDAERKLRFAHKVMTLLCEKDSEGVVRAWFIGCNPWLDENAPFTEIRNATAANVAVIESHVWGAAKSFYSTG